MKGGRHRLEDDETVLLEVRTHPLGLFRPIVIAAAVLAASLFGIDVWSRSPHDVRLALIGLAVLAGFFAVTRVLVWRIRSLVLTDRRLMIRDGLLRRSRHEVTLRQIVVVRTHQSLLERVFGRGRIELELASGGAPLLLEEVSRPVRTARAINAAIDALLGTTSAPDGRMTVTDLAQRLQALYERGAITLDELRERGSTRSAGDRDQLR